MAEREAIMRRFQGATTCPQRQQAGLRGGRAKEYLNGTLRRSNVERALKILSPFGLRGFGQQPLGV